MPSVHRADNQDSEILCRPFPVIKFVADTIFLCHMPNHGQNAQRVLSGNRITLRKDFMETFGVREGDYVDVRFDGKYLTVVAIDVVPKESAPQ